MSSCSPVKFCSTAQLVFKTYGELNARKDNVVVLPTFMTGTHRRNEGFFGPGRALDPSKHFIVSMNMFGNGISSSPTNAHPQQAGSKFPKITIFDNVRCQHRVLVERFGINELALVAGWSMAGCQAYEWAAQYPRNGEGNSAVLRLGKSIAAQLRIP